MDAHAPKEGEKAIDPLTGAVVAAVIWAIVAFTTPALFPVLGAGALGLITDNEGGAFLGALLGWILGIGWFIFALVKAILFVVQAIGLG